MKALTLFIVLFTIPLSSAALHDGWHYAGDEFTVDGEDIYVFHEWGENKVFLTAGDSSHLIRVGKCADANSKEYCLTELQQNLSSEHVTYRAGQAMAGIRIRVEEAGPKVKITKTASKTELDIGEAVTITVTVENTGNRPISLFEYIEEFPPQLWVRGSSHNDKYTMFGSLQAGQSRKIEYSVEAIGFIEHVSKGIVSYEHEEVTINASTPEITLKVLAPFDVEVDLHDHEISLGEDVVYEVIIENDADYNLTVKSLQIFAPGLHPVNHENLTKSRGVLSWGGIIDASGEVELQVRYEPSSSGPQSINLEIVFEDDEGDRLEYYNEEELDVKLTGLEPELELSESIVTSGTKVTATATVNNKEDFQLELLETTLTMFDNVYTAEGEFLDSGEETIFDKTRVAPEVEEETRYTVTFTGRYDAAGEILTFTNSRDLKVLPKAVDAPEGTEEDAEEGSEEGNTEEDSGIKAPTVEQPKAEEQKPSLFTRLANGIVGFFQWLFD
ncbi:hypothetical protein ACFL1B_00435 [Nanoarchaeota archaeon]